MGNTDHGHSHRRWRFLDGASWFLPIPLLPANDASSMVTETFYIGAIIVGAVGGLQFIWQFLDLLLALVVIPNVIAVLFLSGKVKEITNDYFKNLYPIERKK